MFLYHLIQLRCWHKNNTKMFPKREALEYIGNYFILSSYPEGLWNIMWKTAFSSFKSKSVVWMWLFQIRL